MVSILLYLAIIGIIDCNNFESIEYPLRRFTYLEQVHISWATLPINNSLEGTPLSRIPPGILRMLELIPDIDSIKLLTE